MWQITDGSCWSGSRLALTWPCCLQEGGAEWCLQPHHLHYRLAGCRGKVSAQRSNTSSKI